MLVEPGVKCPWETSSREGMSGSHCKTDNKRPLHLLEHWPQAPASSTCSDTGYIIFFVFSFVIVD